MKEMSRSQNAQVTGSVCKGDYALEFIKHVCAVLALDHNVQHDVLVIISPRRFLYSNQFVNMLLFNVAEANLHIGKEKEIQEQKEQGGD